MQNGNELFVRVSPHGDGRIGLLYNDVMTPVTPPSRSSGASCNISDKFPIKSESLFGHAASIRRPPSCSLAFASQSLIEWIEIRSRMLSPTRPLPARPSSKFTCLIIPANSFLWLL